MKVDLMGRRFGRLLVLGQSSTYRRLPVWDCLCDCSRRKPVRHDHLTGGLIVSCGCARRDKMIARSTRHGGARRRDRSAEYGIWRGMIRRCRDPRNNAWAHYGGRGITVCDEWAESFGAFMRDVGPRPTPNHSLERVNNDGSYCKSNCRWATKIEQANNKRTSTRITIRCRTQTVAQWKREMGIPRSTTLTAAVLLAVISFLENHNSTGEA